ncbi:MAG TPA: hypothetical protein VE465_07445 [Streptosporangiaceae bacterium]|jgi:hypothetical protein|nr:hypothetical protein [Streptosporangiaceae bacterium]
MTRSQGRLKEQLQETVREIPVQAARLALFGVGRTLLLTDRVRKDYREARESGLRPVLERWRDDAGQLAGKVRGRVSERTPSRDGSESTPPPASAPEPPVARPPDRKVNTSLAAEPTKTSEPVAKPAPEPETVPEPVPEPTSTPDRVTKLTAQSLPVPDYDDATLASVRARLRTLTAAQVSQLRDYEQEHQARADFLKMFENRIAKLTSGS